MGRPSKLTPEVQTQIENLLVIGCTIDDVCGQVGIDRSTYYNWMKWGEEAKEGDYFDFFDACTRAMAKARITAVQALRSAMFVTQTVEESTETVEETRLRKGKDGKETPYKYTRTITRTRTVKAPADWRAAVEYLKRRDPEHWTDRLKVDDWRSEAIEEIRTGNIGFEELAEVFDHDLATELFKAAGVPVQAGTGQAEN